MAARIYIYRYTYTHIDIKSILIFTNTLTFAKISKDNSRYFLPYRINIVFITTRNIFILQYNIQRPRVILLIDSRTPVARRFEA